MYTTDIEKDDICSPNAVKYKEDWTCEVKLGECDESESIKDVEEVHRRLSNEGISSKRNVRFNPI